MACKKTVKYLGMLMLVILVMCSSLQVFAATHVHEWGSHESIERVYFVESDKVLFTYKDADGHTYEVHRIIEYCKFYKSCYCGARGQCRDGGRTYDKYVRID